MNQAVNEQREDPALSLHTGRQSRPTLANAGARWALVAVVTIYLVMAAGFSQVMPFSRALDEGYHLEYITFIKENGRLPLNYDERAQITRADFPPLYQGLVALVSAKVTIADGPDFKYFWDSFRYRVMDHYGDAPWTIETEDYQWPYRGRFLVWQMGRWLSILLSLATVFVVLFSLHNIPLSKSVLVPLAGAAILAFMPRYIILGSSLNDDNLLGLLAALYFFALVKAIKQPQRWWPFIAVGSLLGLSMTVKYTLVLMPVEIALVYLFLARNKGLGWSWAWRRLGLVAALALFFSSWWFGWNIWFLNTVADDGLLAGTLRPLLTGGTDTTLNRLGGLASAGQVGLNALPENTNAGTFAEWVRATFLTFWGFEVNGHIPLYPEIYLPLGLLLIIAAIGLRRLWVTNRAQDRQWLVLVGLHLLLFLILPLVRFFLTRRLSVAAQGRHILVPGAVAVAGLLVWGLAAVIPQRRQRLAFAVIIAFFIGWSGVHLYQLEVSAAPPLPLRTSLSADWLPNRADVMFGDAVKLTSYAVDPQPGAGYVQLELAWRSVLFSSESYRLRVELVDRAGQVVSYWLGYNGHGRLPTLAWEPGDAIFDRLRLPLHDVPKGDYTLQLQLIGRAGPLPVSGSAGQSTGAGLGDSALHLTNISLNSSTALSLDKSLILDDDKLAGPVQIAYKLWSQDGDFAGTDLTVRYPGTISLISSPGDIRLELVDPTGRIWPVTQRQADIHTFIIGPAWPSGDYRLRASLITEAGEIVQTTAEPLLTVENWWPRQFEVPEIEVAVDANFANQLRFLGYTLPQKQVRPGESFPLTLYWQAILPQADFTQFNHLLDSTGRLRGGYDRRPLEYYSTLLWAPDEVVVDGYAVPVAEDAQPGNYYLDVGYYLTVGESAVNLPLVVDGERTGNSRVTIGPIEVVAP